MTTLHTHLVLQSLELDPFSDAAAELRARFLELEQGDPGLYMNRVALYAAHALQIGEKPPADRDPKFIMLI